MQKVVPWICGYLLRKVELGRSGLGEPRASGVVPDALTTRSDGYLMRRGRASDRDAVAALSARAWPYGEDYVPVVWDEWERDANGLLLVLERDGVLVAVSKVTFLAPHEAWLEGLRVDPAHRRRGLAGWILRVSLAGAGERGATVARFGTAADNVAIHRAAARQGFEVVVTLDCYSAPAQAGVNPSRVLSPCDLRQAWELLRRSPDWALMHGLYETYWTWPELTKERLGAALAAGRVWGRPAGDGLAAVALLASDERAEMTHSLGMGLLAGGPREAQALCRDLRALAADSRRSRVTARLPVGHSLLRQLEAAGFVRDEGMRICIFERRLPGTQSAYSA